MVYKPRAYKKSPIKAACENIPQKKRPISVGASIEQNPWKPTVRKGHIAGEHLLGKPSFKTIPPYLGPKVVDSKKKSAPAYSLKGRFAQRRGHIEDGPAKCNISGLTNKGLNSAPAFSLKSRRPDTKKFQPPAANRYHIDDAVKATTKTIPTFSFGKRPQPLKVIPTPAPNVYNLPPVFGTAKEGQIKAAPAFTMLGREKPRQIPALIMPGPGDYENNYRYIQKISPRFTMRTKHKVISDKHMKPGPAAHCPERYFKHKSVPAPTFAIKYTPYLGITKAYLIPECKPSKPDWIL